MAGEFSAVTTQTRARSGRRRWQRLALAFACGAALAAGAVFGAAAQLGVEGKNRLLRRARLPLLPISNPCWRKSASTAKSWPISGKRELSKACRNQSDSTARPRLRPGALRRPGGGPEQSEGIAVSQKELKRGAFCATRFRALKRRLPSMVKRTVPRVPAIRADSGASLEIARAAMRRHPTAQRRQPARMDRQRTSKSHRVRRRRTCGNGAAAGG